MEERKDKGKERRIKGRMKYQNSKTGNKLDGKKRGKLVFEQEKKNNLKIEKKKSFKKINPNQNIEKEKYIKHAVNQKKNLPPPNIFSLCLTLFQTNHRVERR